MSISITTLAADEIEPNDGTNVATSILNNTLNNGSLSSGTDVDWYKFTPDGDYFNFEFVVDPEVCDASKIGHGWNITIYKNNGVTAIKEYTDVKSGFVTANLAFEEPCYVKVEARNDYVKYAPIDCIYGIKVHTTNDEHWESEKNATSATADVISTDEVYHGSLFEGSDVDWYKFSTDKDYYTISFGLNDAVDYSKVERGWNIYIYLNDGVTLIKEYENITQNFTTPELPFSGDFLVKIEATNDYYTYAPIDCYYDFSVNTKTDAAWENEFNDESSKATKIEMNNTYYGSLYKGEDKDCFVVDNRTGAFTVSIKPDINTSAATINRGWKMNVYPYGSSEPIVTYEGIVSNFETFKLPFVGKYTIKIEASNDYYTYAPIDCVYNLKVTPSAADEIWETENNDAAETANTLKIGDVYNSNLYKGDDKDYFSFETNGKDAYELRFKREISDKINEGWTIKVICSESGEILNLENIGKNSDSYSTILSNLDKNETVVVLVEATNDYHTYAPISVTYCVGVANHNHTYSNNCDETCNTCNSVRKVSHAYKSITTKSTLTKNGKVESKCSVCGAVSKTTTVYYPKTIKLSKTSYTYNGKTQTPSVTVKDSKGNALKKDTDYTVKYASGRKSTGKYAITITFKGKYSGTKTLYFNILPSKTSKITPTCSTTEIKASWKSVTGASGYRVELLNSKGKVVKKIKTTKTSYTFKKLSKVTTYKIRVTAYKTIDKKAAYSSVSTTITTSTAPAKVTLSKLTAGSKSATPAWKTVSGASGYQGKFKSAKTATVSKGSSKKATIKKLTKGKKYYFKVRAYKTVDGKKVYGAWSSVKSVKVK